LLLLPTATGDPRPALEREPERVERRTTAVCSADAARAIWRGLARLRHGAMDVQPPRSAGAPVGRSSPDLTAVWAGQPAQERDPGSDVAERKVWYWLAGRKIHRTIAECIRSLKPPHHPTLRRLREPKTSPACPLEEFTKEK